ncbi:hypothetical protein ACW7G0_03820 [Lysobacter sp. A286]
MPDTTKLEAKLHQFDEIDKRLLIQRTEWGSIDFSAAANDIDSVYEIVSILQGLPLERLPANAISEISNSLDQVWVWIEKSNKFTLGDGNPAGTRDNIVNNIAAVQQALYITTHQWIPFLAYLKGDIPAQLGQITSSVTLAEQAKGDFDEYLSTQRTELDNIIQATREASAEAGVGEFTQDFANDAVDRESDARTWLTRSSVAAVVTLIAAFIFFFLRPDLDNLSVIQYTTSKIVILAMLIAMTAWCAGNYKANKHQAAVSRHKAHALKTFQAFVQASDNPSVKDAVLLETTRSIFTHAQTGFLKSDSPPDGSARILEIIKSAEK